MLSAELTSIVEAVWETMETPIRPSIPPPPDGEATSVAATISFSGAWTGVIAATCSQRLARKLAATMFNVAPSDATDEDLRDAVNELVNIIAGNVRPLLPQPTEMSLPKNEAALAGGPSQDCVSFESEGGALVVRLAGTVRSV